MGYPRLKCFLGGNRFGQAAHEIPSHKGGHARFAPIGSHDFGGTKTAYDYLWKRNLYEDGKLKLVGSVWPRNEETQ